MDNTFIFDIEDLARMELHNLKRVDDYLTPEAEEGYLVSDWFNSPSYMNLVPSWNIAAEGESFAEVFVEPVIEGKMQGFYSFGRWSRDRRGSRKGQEDDRVKIDLDTLKIKTGNPEGFRIKVVLKGDAKLKRAAVTLKLREFENTTEAIPDIDLDVPQRSQMIVPEVGHVICSPTSLSMVLEYYGENHPTREIAELAKDQEAGIYGNWSFTAAVAADFGLRSHVRRLNTIKEAIPFLKRGIPLVASVGIDDVKDLEGVEMPYPDGHLLVVRGFRVEDGREYVLVNDPATRNLDNIKRKYLLSEFDHAFSGIVYVVEK